jgi:putative Mn2+ efflux pump MntP
MYALIQALRHDGPDGSDATGTAGQGLGRLLISGLGLSIDNLAVGFALGTHHVALVTAAVIIGAVSVTMALIGLELGGLLGTRIGDRGEAIGGIVLIGVGIALATGTL